MSEPRVVLEDNNYMDSWKDIEPVLLKYMKQTGWGFSVFNRHCGYSPVLNRDDETIYIRFYAVPENISYKRDRYTYTEFFGISLGSGQDGGITCNIDAAKPVIDPAGKIVAEVEGQTIFVLFNLPCGPHAGELTEFIIAQCFEKGYFELDLEKRRAVRAEQERKIIEDSPANFADLYRNILRDRTESMHTRDSELDSDQKHLELELVKIKDKRQALKALFERSQRALKENGVSISRELFDKLKKMSPSGLVVVRNGKIEIDVGYIDIEYEDVTYDIGDFTLIIDPVRSRVKMINRTIMVQNLSHPHIMADGDPCLGNMRDEVRRLIETMEYDVLVALIMATLRNYNRNDAYCRIDYWPVKEGSKHGRSAKTKMARN
jgi:hypothetical protein